MLSATSNIELEFFRNFLNMFKSKIPISTDFAVSECAITLGRIVAFSKWDELSLGTNCCLGRIVAWDELSLFGIWDELSLFQNGTNCRLGRIVAWDELSLGTNCRLGRTVAFWNLGRIVARDELSLFGIWDELSLGTNYRPTENGVRSMAVINLN